MLFYCDLPPDPKAKDPSPWLPSRAIQCIWTISSTRSSAALDVDAYAEVMLHGNSAGESSSILASLSTVKKRKGYVDATNLAMNWKIELKLARLTVQGTTQRAIQDFTHSTGGAVAPH
jgi:hypothetical protein